jgi:Asp-tRNA(Asn)/Glu-tRNA(Gln) amidotransferase B subunit
MPKHAQDLRYQGIASMNRRRSRPRNPVWLSVGENQFCEFLAQNYFYPDCPELSDQLAELPVVKAHPIPVGRMRKSSVLSEAHLEDAGKSLHEDFQHRPKDRFERAGTRKSFEPDMRSNDEAVT